MTLFQRESIEKVDLRDVRSLWKHNTLVVSIKSRSKNTFSSHFHPDLHFHSSRKASRHIRYEVCTMVLWTRMILSSHMQFLTEVISSLYSFKDRIRVMLSFSSEVSVVHSKRKWISSQGCDSAGDILIRWEHFGASVSNNLPLPVSRTSAMHLWSRPSSQARS